MIITIIIIPVIALCELKQLKSCFVKISAFTLISSLFGILHSQMTSLFQIRDHRTLYTSQMLSEKNIAKTQLQKYLPFICRLTQTYKRKYKYRQTMSYAVIKQYCSTHYDRHIYKIEINTHTGRGREGERLRAGDRRPYEKKGDDSRLNSKTNINDFTGKFSMAKGKKYDG